MNEPCRHEREFARLSDEAIESLGFAGTQRSAVKSFVGAIQVLAKTERERDAANIQLDKIRQLCTEAEAESDMPFVTVSALRTALEEQP